MLACILFASTLFGFVLPISKNNLLEQKKDAIAVLTQTATNIIDHYYVMARSGSRKYKNSINNFEALMLLIDDAIVINGIQREDFFNGKRDRPIADTRKAVSWIAHKKFNMSKSEIARITQMNHATIIHHINFVDDHLTHLDNCPFVKSVIFNTKKYFT